MSEVTNINDPPTALQLAIKAARDGERGAKRLVDESMDDYRIRRTAEGIVRKELEKKNA